MASLFLDKLLIILALCIGLGTAFTITNITGPLGRPRLLRGAMLLSAHEEGCSTRESGGICLSHSECESKGGTSLGERECFNSETCCKFAVTCHPSPSVPCRVEKSGATVTNESPQPERRQYKYPKGTDEVCQLRLDFDEFTLAQPNSDGVCVTDWMQISGGNTKPFLLCGVNTGLHVYIDYSYGSEVTVHFKISQQTSTYKVRSTLIGCSSAKRAPKHCLQYHNDYYGTIKSFNFDVRTPGQHLSNLDYSICVEAQDEMTSIQWSPCLDTEDAFAVSGSPGGQSLQGTECTKDYLQIYGSDRFCGRGLRGGQVSSTIKPFLVNVHFDENEANLLQLLPPGVTLPTNPSNCYISIPIPGVHCAVMGNPLVCTCSIDPFMLDPSWTPEDFVNKMDMDNRGFCLDFYQMW